MITLEEIETRPQPDGRGTDLYVRFHGSKRGGAMMRFLPGEPLEITITKILGMAEIIEQEASK